MAMPLRLLLDPPWRVAAETLPVRGTPRPREAVRIRLRDSFGNEGLGEALPLPGFSLDDANIAWRALAAIASCVAEGGGLAVPDVASVAGLEGYAAAARLDAALAPHAALLDGAPSARYALECALVDLLSRREGVSAARWLADGQTLQRVPVSVLLPDDDGRAVAAAVAAVESGYTVLKLKIARLDRTEREEDALLDALRSAIDTASTGRRTPPRLRLDANGALAPSAVAGRFAALKAYGVELVEEPVAGAAQLSLPTLPLAWGTDESLCDHRLAGALLALPRERRPAALVLKPAHLGLARCLVLAEAAARTDVGLIVTHSFDGDLGHAGACALAAALPSAPWPCGLAPHPGLRAPPPAQAWLPVPDAPGLGEASAVAAPNA
jgi:L-alanine-DL-glutamate epimerase-like enolase superfamily enzyme